jgi:hypothetical protein
VARQRREVGVAQTVEQPRHLRHHRQALTHHHEPVLDEQARLPGEVRHRRHRRVAIGAVTGRADGRLGLQSLGQRLGTGGRRRQHHQRADAPPLQGA